LGNLNYQIITYFNQKGYPIYHLIPRNLFRNEKDLQSLIVFKIYTSIYDFFFKIAEYTVKWL